MFDTAAKFVDMYSVCQVWRSVDNEVDQGSGIHDGG